MRSVASSYQVWMIDEKAGVQRQMTMGRKRRRQHRDPRWKFWKNQSNVTERCVAVDSEDR